MLRNTVLVRALQVAFATAAITAATMPTAMAQSNASGTVYGKIAGGSGDTIVLKNTGTNATRSSAIDANGNFRVTSLPIGTYTATLVKGGATVGTTQLEVLAGQGVEASFDAAPAVAGTTAVQTVRVAGRRNRIDVSSSSNGATFTARELEKLPIGRNVESIVQLAPNTTRSDPSYPAGASFGGGAASENAYYINGMVATNPLTQLGAMELPFGAIAQAQILTGGFGVEFGRSTGGVVNITTKSGTNTWEAGALASITPRSTRASYRDQYYANTGALPKTDGTLYLRRGDNELQQKQLSAYVGGPLIQDTLFGFVALEQTTSEQDSVVGATNSTTLARSGFRNSKTETKRYYGKLDWNINDNHRLEFTAIGDLPKTDFKYRSYNYTTGAVGSTVNSSIHQEFGPSNPNGGELQSLRYVGNLTDNLTVNVLYGKTQSRHIYEPTNYDPSILQISASPENQAPGVSYVGGQSVSSTIPFNGSSDDVTSKRLDLEYKLGNHTLRFGLDNNKAVSQNAGEAYAGNGVWTYLRNVDKNGNPVANESFSADGAIVPALNGGYGPLADQAYYVGRNVYSTISNAYAGQDAQYLEDRWQVTKDLLVTAGVRREGFYNANQDNTKYIEMKNQLAPRINAAWDVNGDGSFKVFGSAGRYTVQIPTMVALRGANGSINTSQYFAYTGTDANGQPTGLTQLTGVSSSNNEFGQAKDPKTVAAQDMKPAFQDEITLGLERQLTPNYVFGAKLTYRTLKSTIDDTCDGRPLEAYAARNNIDASNWHFGCATFNPGEANTFLVDYAGNGTYTRVNLSKEELGFDKPKRTYAALDVSLEHPYRNGWYAKVNYTLGRNKGNTEGQTLSDTATAQGDVAATQTWDYPELMVGTYGLLPNDRKHQLKAFGFYDLTPEVTVGGNLLLASGRPRSCSGTNPNTFGKPELLSYNYQSASRYCFGATGATNTLVPRGSLGRLPWEKTIDLNAVYKPKFAPGLSLRVDVYNVLNDQSVQKVNERYNTNAARYALYEMGTYFTAPRAAKFTAEYNYKFK